MSVHPRNPYKTQPDFKLLAKTFPEFAEISTIDPAGKVKLDFKNQESIRILTKCLLKKDFDLDVEIPQDRLVPTLTLRLNYILWLEDLLEYSGRKKDIFGIDIGTGATAIYCLLAARMKKWKMIGLEVDEFNIKSAQDNISRNNLEELITILVQDNAHDKFFSKLEFPRSYDFCMVNPPFYSSADSISMSKNRTGKRKHSSSQIRGADTEVVCGGGETEFVNRLIQESVELKEKIRIYTTMLGHKSSISDVKTKLEGAGISNFTTTEFVQGNTTRWAVAWSFCEDLDLKLFGTSNTDQYNIVKKNNHVLSHLFECPEAAIPSFEQVKINLVECLTQIKFKFRNILESPKKTIWEVSAFEKTWMNLRRKRREQKRLEAKGEIVKPINDPLQHSNKVPSLFLGLELSQETNGFLVQVFFISGDFGKVCAGEVMQYIKNHFKVSADSVVCKNVEKELK